MLLSLLLVAVITAGGSAVTYLIERDEPFLWRAAAGCVIGSGIFGTIAFLLSMAGGLTPITAVATLVVTMLPLAVFYRADARKNLRHDWAKAKGKLEGANRTKALRFIYYAAFLLLFVLFFQRAMIVTDQGIFTGGSNNLGDLPFHLGAIFGFTDGANFPPQNPSFAGARFSYPFIADLVTAAFMELGAGVTAAMVVQNVAWAFSLLIILERFVLKLTGDRLAGKIAPVLLFLSGGLGFIWFFGDFGAQAKGFFDFVWQIPKDYTISDNFRWGNSLVTLFITQRSLLLGMPLTIVVLNHLWKIFRSDEQDNERFSLHFLAPHFVVGLIAGLLPLVHLHSLAVLFITAAFLLFLRLDKWREWLAFGVGVAIIAVPELVWSITGSATETSKFFGWHFGWDSGDANFVWFWLKNTGILFPLIVGGMWLVYTSTKRGSDEGENVSRPIALLQFYLPFAFLFLLSNIAKLAPWEWDNIKVLIYWYVGSIPFAAIAISWMWKRSSGLKAVAAACFLVMILSGSLDVWRTASGQIKNRVFEPDGVAVAEKIKRTTDPHALFLNAPTYNSAVVLSGRQSLMRYSGHLGSHGIDYAGRERDVKSIYAGGANADELMRKYGIDYVLISPEERNSVAANEQFFKKYPLAAEAGQYKIYKIK